MIIYTRGVGVYVDPRVLKMYKSRIIRERHNGNINIVGTNENLDYYALWCLEWDVTRAVFKKGLKAYDVNHIYNFSDGTIRY